MPKYQQNKIFVSYWIAYCNFVSLTRRKKPGESGQTAKKVWMWVRGDLGKAHQVQQCQVQGPVRGQGSPKHNQKLDGEWSESSPKKDSGELVDENLDSSQQCQEISRVLGCSVASRSGEGIVPVCSIPLSLALVRPTCSAVPGSGTLSTPTTWIGATPEEAMKMIWVLEQLCYEERVRELGLLSLEKKRLWGDLRAPFSV